MLDTKTPYKIYGRAIETEALHQFEKSLNMKGCVQGALMADAHTGYTAPIGSVLKFKDVISPSLIGYDIGCGVCATKLDIKKEDLDLEALKEYILKNIPIGFNRHSEKQGVDMHDTNHLSEHTKKCLVEIGDYQLGTLGGGNHFIEIGESDFDDRLWIIIHSGSRGFGHKVAERYMKEASALHAEPFDEGVFRGEFLKNNREVAKYNPQAYEMKLNKGLEKARKKHIKDQDAEGYFGFDTKSLLGEMYLDDMNYCLNYALLNRYTMVGKIIKGIREQTACKEVMFINRNHNHAEIKEGYVIHRKGATHAEKGMWGAIPANMRDGTFIVRGKGNPESMSSSSHGAGRVLSRAQAKKRLDVTVFMEEMNKIVTNHTEEMLDESPEAYKDIFEVMDLQKDLVTVIERSIPILNIKG